MAPSTTEVASIARKKTSAVALTDFMFPAMRGVVASAGVWGFPEPQLKPAETASKAARVES